MTELTTLEPLTEIPNIYVARKSALRSTAFVLKDGSVCLWSPLAGLAEKIKNDLAEIGPVQFLCAPNYYHNKALAEYAKSFPRAILCAPEAAHERLKKVTRLDFNDLSKLKKLLPKHLDVIQPKGLKNGEVWMRSKLKGVVCWFVVDALCGEKMTAKKDRGTTISMLGTFPKFGIGDSAVYSSWALKQLAADRTTLVVPCHGTIVANAGLSEAIKEQFSSL